MQDALEKKIMIVFTLRTTDDFASPFRSEHVHRKHNLFVFRIALHVERLHLCWVAVNDTRTIELLHDGFFLWRTKVFAPWEVNLNF